jgi:hypothetical protein
MRGARFVPVFGARAAFRPAFAALGSAGAGTGADPAGAVASRTVRFVFLVSTGAIVAAGRDAGGPAVVALALGTEDRAGDPVVVEPFGFIAFTDPARAVGAFLTGTSCLVRALVAGAGWDGVAIGLARPAFPRPSAGDSTAASVVIAFFVRAFGSLTDTVATIGEDFGAPTTGAGARTGVVAARVGRPAFVPRAGGAAGTGAGAVAFFGDRALAPRAGFSIGATAGEIRGPAFAPFAAAVFTAGPAAAFPVRVTRVGAEGARRTGGDSGIGVTGIAATGRGPPSCTATDVTIPADVSRGRT